MVNKVFFYPFIFLIFISFLPSQSFSEDIDLSRILKSKTMTNSSSMWIKFLDDLALSTLIEGKDFAKGKNFKLKYDFKNPSYKKLLEEYKILDIAGTGSSFQKLVNIMDYFAPRLTHYGAFNPSKVEEFKGKKSADIHAYELLKYSLDNKDHGINCVWKSKIFYEIALALGIYVRKVNIQPLYKNMDSLPENHQVIEMWNESLNKWIMLDITSDMYWSDSNNTPLSIVELREKLINEEKGLKVVWASNAIKELKSKYKNEKEYELEYAAWQYYQKLYYSKNLYVITYWDNSGSSYYLVPNNFSYKNKVSKYLITRTSVETSPLGK